MFNILVHVVYVVFTIIVLAYIVLDKKSVVKQTNVEYAATKMGNMGPLEAGYVLYLQSVVEEVEEARYDFNPTHMGGDADDAVIDFGMMDYAIDSSKDFMSDLDVPTFEYKQGTNPLVVVGLILVGVIAMACVIGAARLGLL